MINNKTENTVSNQDVITTMGLALSVIGTDLFLSAGLSSPWSVSKFAISDADKQEVWRYFNKAAVASLSLGAMMAYKLKTIWPVIGSTGTILYYKRLYNDAMSRTPTQNPTPVLAQSYYIPLTDQYKLEIENIIKNSNPDPNLDSIETPDNQIYDYIIQDYS